MPACAETLRGIINDPQIMKRGKIHDRRIIGRLAKQADADNADNGNARFSGAVQCRIKLVRVKIEAVLFDLGKDWHRAHHRHHLGAGGKGKGRHNNTIVRL